MAQLFFIAAPGNMSDTDFGLDAYFTGFFTATVQPPDSVGLIDSGTGNSITVRVNLPLPASVNDATVISLDVRTAFGEQLMWWFGLGPRVGQLVALGPGGQMTAYMQGDDLLYGSQFSDVLKGFAGADELRGFAGHDVLDGGTGADRMIGGPGATTYVVDNAGDIVEEDAAIFQPLPVLAERISALATGDVRYVESPTISADGQFIAFVSLSGPVITPYELLAREVCVVDLSTGDTDHYALSSGQFVHFGSSPSLSEDGRFLVFKDHLDVYQIDRQTGVKTIVSADTGNSTTSIQNLNLEPSVSGDGRYVVYTANGYTPWAGDADSGNPSPDVILRDMTGGYDEISSPLPAVPGGGDSVRAEITPDARYVVFDSIAPNLVAGGDVGAKYDVFLADRQAGTVERVSSANGGGLGDGDSINASVSPDGRYVVYESLAQNLGGVAGNGKQQIFLFDHQLGTTTRVSTLPDGTPGNGDSSDAQVSADGRFVAFESLATNLTSLDGAAADIFLKDMATGQIAKLSVGHLIRQESTSGYDPVMSADGSVIAFLSMARVTADDTNNAGDVFAVLNPFVQPVPEYRDSVRANIHYTLQGDIEDLILTGTASLTGTGNALDNVLVGNSGANVLDGGGGNDTMAGGAGDDTYVVDSTDDVVQEAANQGNDRVFAMASYTLSAHIERLELQGTNLNGTGNAQANVLKSNGGSNVLIGAGGDDQYEVSTGDSVVELAGGGFDIVRADVSFALPDNVEQLILTGGAAGNLSGNTGDNALTGNTGDNTLDGGRGGDTMAGGQGNDGYRVDNALDQISESAGQGEDSAIASVSYALGANIENLTLAPLAGNAGGIGNGGNNVLEGNSRANVLDGGAGNDTLKGHAGDDTLIGGAGDDRLSGGTGRDTLYGDAGADRFVFDAAITGVVNIDLIVDFVRGVDRIELASANFGGLGLTGSLSADRFVGGAGALAHDALDRIVHDNATGMLYYDADGSGAQGMLAFALVTPGLALAATDFVVAS